MLNLSSDEMEALVEHREKLDAELEQLRENRMELEAEIEGKENALNITKLKQECVDQRFDLVSRGCAPYVEYLGIQENPKSKGWAAGAGYGEKILKILDAIKETGSSQAGNEVHVGAVLRNGETFARSGSKKTYIDQEGQRKRRVKLWDRSTSLHIVIADTSEEKVEEILENFLRNLKKGIDVDGNWVNIVVGEADWVEEGDSILKAKVAVQFDITFEGGIYQDRDIKPMDIGSVG